MAIAIAYDAPSDTITVTGGTEGTPATFTDIQVANDGGGWGQITNLCDRSYCLSANLKIGDGFISTFLNVNNEQISQKYKHFEVKANATLSLDGSHWYFQAKHLSPSYLNGGTINLQRSLLWYRGSHLSASSGVIDFDDSIIVTDSASNSFIFYQNVSGSIDNLYCQKIRDFSMRSANITTKTINVNESADGIGGAQPPLGATFTVKDALVTGFTSHDTRADRIHLVLENPRFHITTPYILQNNYFIKESYTCNIHIADKDGANLGTVNVKCEDKDDNEIFSVNTDGAGDIAEQIITYKKWIDTTETLTTYSPHKFTISKAGYETMVLDEITVDAPIVWHLELLDELAEGDVRDGVAYGEDSEGNLELPAVGDVESGVGYGSNGVEFTGDFEVPPEADVRDGEGYGAGGAEFTGALDLPAIGDVEKGVQFDSLTKTGTFKSPAEADVRDGSQYGKDDIEFTGTLDLPIEADVEDGIGYGAGGVEFEGDLELPAEEDVEVGVGYGSLGTEFEGDLEVPAIEDVRDGIGFGADGTELVGILDLPSISDVKLHTIFDNGTKTGTYICPIPAGEMIAYLEGSTEIEGYLEEGTNLTGEIES